jgi:hypothetical protein
VFGTTTILFNGATVLLFVEMEFNTDSLTTAPVETLLYVPFLLPLKYETVPVPVVPLRVLTCPLYVIPKIVLLITVGTPKNVSALQMQTLLMDFLELLLVVVYLFVLESLFKIPLFVQAVLSRHPTQPHPCVNGEFYLFLIVPETVQE